MSGVVGLDLSLRAAAGVYLSESWDPRKPAHGYTADAWGYELPREATPRERAIRVASICDGVLAFVRFATERSLVLHVFVEDHAYGLSGQSGVVLAEMVGAVKHAIYDRFSAVVIPAPQSSVRKYLLGKLPSGKGTRGPAVQEALARLGFAFPTSDAGDAFAVANYGRAELGLPGVTLAR